MDLVVGLGNIGKEYETTRHNVGFLVVENLLQKLGSSKEKKVCNAIVCECNLGGRKIVVARPTTYMNASGIAVASLEKKFAPDRIIVVHDDIDVKEGTVRLRTSGSAGTHNGMKSVLQQISDPNFVRVRVGAGRPMPEQNLADFVLSHIPKSSPVWEGIELATGAVYDLVSGTDFQEVCQKYSK